MCYAEETGPYLEIDSDSCAIFTVFKETVKIKKNNSSNSNNNLSKQTLCWVWFFILPPKVRKSKHKTIILDEVLIMTLLSGQED
jgi:hypothetical protein